jgi:putative tricarboxylic transport membrane protein
MTSKPRCGLTKNRNLLLEVVLWAALAFLIAYKSLRLDVGTLSSPGPGLMPFISALFLLVLALSMFIQMARSKEDQKAPAFDFKRALNPFLIGFFIIGFVIVFKVAGYILSCFLLMVVLLKIAGNKSWKLILGTSFVVTSLSYILFGVVLKLSLPAGMLSFLR